MKFDVPAGPNPTDQLKVLGRATDRIDGPLKTTGTAPYAYEHSDLPVRPAYGFILGAGIGKGRIAALDASAARAAPGVLAVITAANAGPLGTGAFYIDRQLAGPEIDHYHQAIAIVVAETFEQARAGAALLRVRYEAAPATFDIAAAKPDAATATPDQFNHPPVTSTGDFEGAFATAPVQLDATYTTPDQTHTMMEPHATVALWQGDQLVCWSPIQHMSWGVRDLSRILGIPPQSIRIIAPFIGGSFGGKGSVLSDTVAAALAARVVRRPVKVALTRPLMANNTTRRAATIQRIRIGATPDGTITAIGHESWSGNLPGARYEPATTSTRQMYAGANRMTHLRFAVLNLAEGSSMRARGEATGQMALEIAMDEMAEKLGLDPVRFRIINDTQVDPEDPKVRDGEWLVGMGVAGAIRSAGATKSAARVTLDRAGDLTVECDMTDVGTGTYTILAQTVAEMMGVGLNRVVVRMGDSHLPTTPGSGGQVGAASATSGVYAACVKLREMVAEVLGFGAGEPDFADGYVQAGNLRLPLAQAAATNDMVAEDEITYGTLAKQFSQQTFGAHFVEAGVHAATGEIRLRRMLAVCASGRILNPKSARSQVIGAMTMGAGAALMEDLGLDAARGYFVNHDMAGYEVPVQAWFKAGSHARLGWRCQGG